MPYQACTQTGGQFAAKLIENRVRSLEGLVGIWPFDFDDIRQELWSELARKWPKYDPKRGPEHAFIRNVIESKIAKLLEYAKAQCRDYRKNACSLDENALDAEGAQATIGELIDIEDLLPLAAWGANATWPAEALRTDLQTAMEALDQAEASLCQDLLSLSILEISQLRGIPRASLYDALRRIREKVAPILAEYLPSSGRQNSERSGNRK